ncbi:hypothetical protein [Sphingomonas bacterium]|uniref:hypothetical protein n=1 Tax=Sphingomonas bacterium TaxID=1895847 RepID=UPI0015753536|nr:hypothetical protein [Sphingomonas bacterium]
MTKVGHECDVELSGKSSNSAEEPFAANLIRDLAVKGLSAPRSLDFEEISQLCLAVLAHLNNNEALDI